MKIGKYIKARRQELHMMQKDLAKAVGYADVSSISKIEHDLRTVPIPQLEKIAQALDCTVESLLGFDDVIESDMQHRLPNGDVLFIVKTTDYQDGCMVLVGGEVWQLYHSLSDGYMLVADRHTRHTDGSDIEGKIIARLIRYE